MYFKGVHLRSKARPLSSRRPPTFDYMYPLKRVATLPNNAELELAGIKFKNGFNVEIPNDLLHTHPGLSFSFGLSHLARTLMCVSSRPAGDRGVLQCEAPYR